MNFLVNDWRLTDEALPATVIDLAARDVVDIEQRGPGVFYVRLRDRHDESLTTYETRVLDHLRERAHDQVVPAAALTTGPEQASKRWHRRFANEVVADAQARGLSRDAFDGRAFTLLLAAAVLYWFGPPLADAGPIGVGILLVPCAAVLIGVALTVMALLDLGSMVELTGPILRLREFGSDERRRYYAAIDDGSSRAIRAFRIDPRHYVGLSQGQQVTVNATKNLGCVRWIIDASGPEPAWQVCPGTESG